MNNIYKIFLILISTLLLTLSISNIYAQESVSPKRFTISFTGIGCPHCAKVAPKLHEKVQDGSLIVIEYEIYKNIANAQVLNEYADEYDLSLGIPQIFFKRGLHESGDTPILSSLDQMIEQASANEISLVDGSVVTFTDLPLSSLERYPSIYSKDRVAIRKSLSNLSESEEKMIKDFIYSDTIEKALESLEGQESKTEVVSTPGGTLIYDNALKIDGWLLQWNGVQKEGVESTSSEGDVSSDTTKEISLGKIVSLGLADSVNPCALSILALVLISIVTYNPGSRKKILLAGLSFVAAVLLMYLIYGFLIIKAFEVAQSITSIREFLYGTLGINFILGLGAIILGVLGLKDFFSYKPGSVGTEMPLFLRPKVSKIVAKVTSPLAAFTVGLFVTLFLLPCTIGPYIILGGLLANEGFLNALPSLVLYNLIFVSPMVGVTLLVYFGSKKGEDVQDWKEKNVRYMHLIAGILLLVIGVLMVLGKF